MRILILGSSGMLGFSLYANLSLNPQFDVFGTVRNIKGKERYFQQTKGTLFEGVEAFDFKHIERIIGDIKPQVVLNCIGLIKQLSISKEYTSAIKVNALLPHELAEICSRHGARFIHFSTDCVFDGKKGCYIEDDLPTATDLYGRTKYLGEVGYNNHLTLRTSIIGHELTSRVSLVDWFLSQENFVKGFSRAIFSGFPTAYIAKLLIEKIIPESSLHGVYHLSAMPINKYELLTKIAESYGKEIVIHESTELVIDRSLDSSRLRAALNFTPPDWNELVAYMKTDYNKWYSL